MSRKPTGPLFPLQLFTALCDLISAGDPRDTRPLNAQAEDIWQTRHAALLTIQSLGLPDPKEAMRAFEMGKRDSIMNERSEGSSIMREHTDRRNLLKQRFPDWKGWSDPEWWRQYLDERDTAMQDGAAMLKRMGIQTQPIAMKRPPVPRVDPRDTGDALFISERDFKQRQAGQ